MSRYLHQTSSEFSLEAFYNECLVALIVALVS